MCTELEIFSCVGLPLLVPEIVFVFWGPSEFGLSVPWPVTAVHMSSMVQQERRGMLSADRTQSKELSAMLGEQSGMHVSQ